ncbi:MAG TPA: GH116 family glycosyl-hydrolase [Hanamia sp.]|nr:GH116 family glycosyl-hydrolase [Hanamia sp.]
MERRKFLKATGLLTATGFFSPGFPLIAGPFTMEDFLKSYFPDDKKLDAEWLQSLFERGNATIYKKTRNELQYIGMPVGGICAGGVYVGGDGRLWLWDIFNQNQLGVITEVLPVPLESFRLKEINNTEGSLYLEPLTETGPLQQGFALSVKSNGTTSIKRLHQDDWEEIIFEATYPVATIKYIDKAFPVEVTMQAFSPFIPGNAKDSGLPATVQVISLRNVSADNIEVEVIGWLENKLLYNSEKYNKDFTRINRLSIDKSIGGISLECSTGNDELKKAADYGNMFFAVLSKNAKCIDDVFKSKEEDASKIKDLVRGSQTGPMAGIICKSMLDAGQSTSLDFAISWYTPNICFYCSEDGKSVNPQGMTVQGADTHYYSTFFENAEAVANYLAQKYQVLKEQTILWKETWYDSTLPWWFLERTFMNISTMATTTTHRFQSGRYYAWEGVGCCHGTCTHVYSYAQAISRIFPELERDTRERVDLGVGYDDATGMIRYRGEKTGPSIDGQAGTVLRIYREHQMSSDYTFLRNYWPKIKKAIIFVMEQDKNHDGMEDTPMENTLDALWHGEISWIVGLCIAAVRAGQAMAEEMNDTRFAEQCREYVEKGSRNMESYLFNGEYFIHRPDPKIGKKEIGSFNTCDIDQVYGQCWAWQVNLGRILSKEKTMSALQSLWKYNYMPDVGPYIKKHPGGRFYALAGEGGMIMNTNPERDVNPYGNAKAWQIGYFSECMSGFEHMVASHMMAEGMAQESLVLTRSIHDRYHAYKRNPFNEIECSDHYGRAMASYGTFISVCGFAYHGPKGHIGFSPRLTPEDFRAPFTSAKGWGTFSQKRNENLFSANLKVKYGELKIKRITVELDRNQIAGKAELMLDNALISCTFNQTSVNCEINTNELMLISAGQSLSLKIS